MEQQSVHEKQQVLSEMLEFLASGPGTEQGTVREDLILRRVCGLIQTDELTSPPAVEGPAWPEVNTPEFPAG